LLAPKTQGASLLAADTEFYGLICAL
jgi:hypothetical protein